MDGGRDAPYPWKREQPGRSPRTPARQVGKANQLESTLPNLDQLGPTWNQIIKSSLIGGLQRISTVRVMITD